MDMMDAEAPQSVENMILLSITSMILLVFIWSTNLKLVPKIRVRLYFEPGQIILSELDECTIFRVFETNKYSGLYILTHNYVDHIFDKV